MNTLSELQHYRYRGARTLILLQERTLRDFVDTWRRAKAAEVKLPESKSPNYQSLDALLRHVIRVPQMNMLWITEQLALPDPLRIDDPPPPDAIADKVDDYLNYLLPKLRQPLAEVEPERFFRPTYVTRWKQEYTVESMLEHLVTHAMRHSFQLEELMALQGGGAIREG